MLIIIIYNWTDDEPTADKDKEPEPEPDQDENRTDLENRERRDDTESQDRLPAREDIEMESEAQSMKTDSDFFAEIG